LSVDAEVYNDLREMMTTLFLTVDVVHHRMLSVT